MQKSIKKIYKIYKDIKFRLSADSGYWELCQDIKNNPSGNPGRKTIFGWDIEYLDAVTLKWMLKWQFIDGVNDFISERNDPYILDVGANIGISVLRYKHLFPQARITAFEPNPRNYEILVKNIKKNNLNDVDAVPAAVWVERKKVQFSQTRFEGGHILKSGANEDEIISVQAIPLSDYLQQKVDFIKLDIEGSELPVLLCCREEFKKRGENDH